jgi:DNA-binding Xre family transcriptional regulator
MYEYPYISALIILGYSYIVKSFFSTYNEKKAKEFFTVISYAPLFETMKRKKITSYRLEKLGFSRATYYSIQKGNSVSTNTINQLCKILKCNVTDVIEFINEDEDNQQNQ